MTLLRTFLLSLLVIFAAPAAHAQSDADRAAARNLAIEGQEALEAEDYATAAEKFERAEALYHAPTLLLGLARSYRGLGKYVEAMEAYNKVIREKLDERASDAFKKAVEDAKREIEGLGQKVAWVVVEVEGPASPSVTLDGQPLSGASLGVKRPINPGDHVLAAEGPGFAPGEHRFSIEAGEQRSIVLTLEARDEPDLPPPPGGAVASDDDTFLIVGAVILAVGGAGLIVGAVTGGMALGKHNDLVAMCPDDRCLPEQEDDLESFRTLGNVSTVGFVAGGVLAAVGLTLIVIDLTSEGAGSDHARLELGPTSARASFRF